jgi:hypothetical protein
VTAELIFLSRKKQLEESFVDVKQRKLDVMKAWNAESSSVSLKTRGYASRESDRTFLRRVSSCIHPV